jgi:pyruvate,water dikinase
MYYNLTSIHDVLRSAPFGDYLAAWFDQFVGADDEPTERGGAWARKGFVHDVREVAVIAASTSWQYLFLTTRVEEFERTVADFAARTHPSTLPAKSTDALVADMRAFMDIRCNRWKNASLADAASMICYGVLQRLLARAFPSDAQQALHNTLLKALPDLASSRPPVEMWKLSRMIRSNPALRDLMESSSARVVLERLYEGTDVSPGALAEGEFSEFRHELEKFLEDWGFRCSAELMLTSPSFQEDPEPLIDLLKSYASMDGDSPVEQLERQTAERLRDTSQVLQRLRRQPLSRWLPFVSLAPVVGTVLKWTQRAIQLRERARLKQALLYSRLRRVALALGGQLASRGRLTQAEDVFFLTVEEVDLLATGGEMFPHHAADLIALRRRAHPQLARTAPPDSIHLAAGDYLEVAASETETASLNSLPGPLTGVGACGGSSTARAAILLDVTESQKLTPGSILVTRQTDPGWGPIFPLISGLVIERGGMLSHGAIIAREFGIPSVVGVKNATRLIPHGGSITVDGDRGLVQLLAGGAG